MKLYIKRKDGKLHVMQKVYARLARDAVFSLLSVRLRLKTIEGAVIEAEYSRTVLCHREAIGRIAQKCHMTV